MTRRHLLKVLASLLAINLSRVFSQSRLINYRNMEKLLEKTTSHPGPRRGYADLLGWENLLYLDRVQEGANCGARVRVRVEDFAEHPTALSGPFQSFNFEAFLLTNTALWREAFVTTALKVLEESQPCSAEGAWLHPKGRWGVGHGVLLDSFQEEASRLVKLAWLIRQGKATAPQDPADLENLALEQFDIHREILRDPETGLWHNGFDWVPGELSPGYWSRGHGWLLRGLTQSLQYAEEPAVIRGLSEILQEAAESLARYQRPDGLWRAIIPLPDESSPPETSGSAMIAAGLLRGIQLGILAREPFEKCAMGCAETLLRDYLTKTGTVRGACPGPGPLLALDGYLQPVNFPDDEPHGIAAFLALHCALTLHKT